MFEQLAECHASSLLSVLQASQLSLPISNVLVHTLLPQQMAFEHEALSVTVPGATGEEPEAADDDEGGGEQTWSSEEGDATDEMSDGSSQTSKSIVAAAAARERPATGTIADFYGAADDSDDDGTDNRADNTVSSTSSSKPKHRFSFTNVLSRRRNSHTSASELEVPTPAPASSPRFESAEEGRLAAKFEHLMRVSQGNKVLGGLNAPRKKGHIRRVSA
jgi:hypothetical protein